jgi:hypothetical protein
LRYAPERAFPAYAFLPGRDPHPTRDRSGHSFGLPEPDPVHLAAERWRDNRDYLFGVDLYNHGYLWEAHEAWEGLWHAAKRDPVQAEHLQGLIQCAAACLKARMGQPRGVERLTELGTARLERVARASGGAFMGIDLDELVAAMRAFAAEGAAPDAPHPRIELDEIDRDEAGALR